MKKLLSVMLLLATLTIIADISMRKEDERPEPTKFQEAMNFANFNTYTDNDLNYTFSYPSFFKESSEAWYGTGHVSFSYHNNGINLIMTCRVLPKRVITCKDSSFTTSQAMQDFSEYVSLSRGVLRENCWYVLTFCYPREYRKAVSRIISRVISWQAEPPRHLITNPPMMPQYDKTKNKH